jgi:hypothetical protein
MLGIINYILVPSLKDKITKAHKKVRRLKVTHHFMRPANYQIKNFFTPSCSPFLMGCNG